MNWTQKKFMNFITENNIVSLSTVDDTDGNNYHVELGRCDVLGHLNKLYSCIAIDVDGNEFNLQVDTHAFCAFINDDWSAYE